MNKLDNSRRSAGLMRFALRSIALATVIFGVALTTGCKRDARLADAKLRTPVVKNVTYAGLTLDRNATPEMVTFALLQAIKADIEASKDLAARERAFDVQLDLAAPLAIRARHTRVYGPEHTELNESVYKAVHAWAPTLAHYVGSFSSTFDEALKQMQVQIVPTSSRLNQRGVEEQHVRLEVQNPNGDPNASVIIRVRLVREDGHWRVWWVGFDHTTRHLRKSNVPGDS